MGEKVTLPYNVVVSDPLTDKAEKISAEFIYSGDGNHFCRITYKLLNTLETETLGEFTFDVTGAEFTALVAGIGGTLKTRLDAEMSTDLQSRRTTQPK